MGLATSVNTSQLKVDASVFFPLSSYTQTHSRTLSSWVWRLTDDNTRRVHNCQASLLLIEKYGNSKTKCDFNGQSDNHQSSEIIVGCDDTVGTSRDMENCNSHWSVLFEIRFRCNSNLICDLLVNSLFVTIKYYFRKVCLHDVCVVSWCR